MHGWKRAVSLAAAAVLAATVAVGCGSSDESSSGQSAQGNKDPVKILAVLDMTGPTKFLGEADKAGLDAAVTYLNSKGGIDGRKVELNVASDNGDPTTSVTTLTKEVTSGDKPAFVLPGSYSSIAAALQPVLTRNGLLSWGFGNFAPCSAENCGPFFELNGPTSVQMQQAVQDFQKKGYKKIGIIQDQRDTSVSETEELKKQIPAAGLGAEYVTVPANAVNYTPQMNKLKSAGVDVVFGEVIGQGSGYVLDARDKLNWDVPVILDVSASSTGITAVSKERQWKDNVEMQVFSCIDPSEGDTYPGIQLMLDNDPDAIGAGGFGGQPINVAAYTFDAVMLLNSVVSATHSLDPKVNQEWLEQQSSVIDEQARAMVSTHKYTADDHLNQGWEPENYKIVPVAPVDEKGLLATAG